jgi:hypothetical protein
MSFNSNQEALTEIPLKECLIDEETERDYEN